MSRFDETLFDELAEEAVREALSLTDLLTTLEDPECYSQESSRLAQIVDVMAGLVGLTTAVRKLVRAGRVTRKAGPEQ